MINFLLLRMKGYYSLFPNMSFSSHPSVFCKVLTPHEGPTVVWFPLDPGFPLGRLEAPGVENVVVASGRLGQVPKVPWDLGRARHGEYLQFELGQGPEDQ